MLNLLNMEICNECQAKIIKYWHSLNKHLCSALIKIYSQHGLEPVKISHILSHNQLCNFQKLKYWDLVEKCSNEPGKGGYWRITNKGERFIKGTIAVSQRVQTFRGQAVDRDGGSTMIIDIIEGYQYKPDYLRELE